MRLYHSRPALLLPLLGMVLILLGACTSPQATQPTLSVTLRADGSEMPLQVAAGSTVESALKAAQLELGPLDRTEPPGYTVLSQGAEIRVVRVTEEFETAQTSIPFEHQVLRNESLPQGKENEVYLQRGQNGLQEITYRRLLEDGVEVSNNPVKSVVVQEPVPEIVMIGIQTPFFPIELPGRLAYLRDGSAWVMESATGNRRAVVTTGDLDGRIFSMSDDGSWLLFTRHSQAGDQGGADPAAGQINSLWAVDLTAKEPQPVDLKVPNIIHFADWVPGTNNKIVFSTVEPRSTAPGWQANNDLHALTLSASGWTSKWATILEPNSGGVYGWWGSSFGWDPAGQRLALVQSDGIHLVDFKEGVQSPLVSILPFTTRGDWAWVPGISWGPDGQVLYFTQHAAVEGAASPEDSQVFDLVGVLLQTGQSLPLVSQTGMFAYPLASPLQSAPGGEAAFQIAYLQATFPNQSETSRYQVAVIDRDGSDRRVLFPAEGLPGLTPQRDWAAWSPEPMPGSGAYALAVIYEGNLWLVDAETGASQQVTGDGLTSRLVWK